MNNELLLILAKATESSIGGLTSPAVLARGRDYYEKGKVLSFIWFADNAVSAWVDGGSLYKVTIKQGLRMAPVATCSCPYSKEWGSGPICKHSVAVLLMASALLNNHKDFPEHLKNEKKDLLQQLTRGIAQATIRAASTRLTSTEKLLEKKGKKKSSAGAEQDPELNVPPAGHPSLTELKYTWALHLYPDATYWNGKRSFTLDVTLTKDGKKTQGLTQLPVSLKPLFEAYNDNRSDAYGQAKPGAFEELLTYFSKFHAIYVYTEDQVVNATYDKRLAVTPITEFTSNQDGIFIRRLGKQGTTFCEDFVCLSTNLYLDVKAATLGRIANNVGNENWRVAAKLGAMPFGSPWYPAPDFVQYAFPCASAPVKVYALALNNDALKFDAANKKQLENFIFKQDDAYIVPASTTFDYGVSMSINKNSGITTLAATVAVGNEKLEKPGPGFFMGTALYSIMQQYEQCLREPEDRKTFMALIGKVITVHGQSDLANIVTAIKHPTNNAFVNRVPVLLEQFYTNFIGAQEPKFQLATVEGKFYYVARDYRKSWYLYAVACELFPRNRFDYNAMSVEVDSFTLLHNFKQIKAMFDAESIDLRLNNKKVAVSKFSISVDATRSGDIDWFEVKPEIKMDGQLLSEGEWHNVVAGGGMVELDDIIHIMDFESEQAMAVLARLFGKRALKKQDPNDLDDLGERPRLQIFDLIDLMQHNIQVSLSDTDKGIVSSLLNFKQLPSTPLPVGIQATLRDYQKDGYRWLAFLYAHRFGACLADDMGLGKTVQTIAFLGGIQEGLIQAPYNNKGPHLVVVPPNLIFNWAREIEKFYPTFKVMQYVGAQRSMKFDGIDVVITSYDTLRSDQEEFTKKFFDVIIFDEAQAIKNIKAQRTVAARALNGNFKLCLTGTPVENHIGEYYSIIDLAVPGLITDLKNLGNDVVSGALSGALQRTKPFVLRRTKAEILTELPPKIEQDVYLSMSASQKKVYNKISLEVKGLVDDAYAKQTKGRAGIIALTAILRLRQICISPELAGIKSADVAPKIDYMVDQLQELVREGHAALVFSQFVGTFDILERQLQKAKVPYLRIDGSTPLQKRKEIVDAFEIEKTVAVLLLSLKVGGVGLNLTRANYVFHIDPWWNPSVENQATDRAHRIGQKNKLTVIRLVMQHSIEEKMQVLKKRKKELFDTIMDGTLAKGGAISKADFDFLLG